jgi:membrane-associated protein
MEFLHLIIHLDQYIATVVTTYHSYFYLLLFVVIFCETGLVITPFLPGDSLLFVTGGLASTGILQPLWLATTIFAAAFLGDNSNFFVGKILGERLFKNPKSKIFRRKYLHQTHQFYSKHGVQTIIIARFIPFLRTFAPFVAGIAKMHYLKFIFFSCIASILWVSIFLAGGFFFANLPIIKNHLSLIILGVMLLSIIPILGTLIREFRYKE